MVISGAGDIHLDVLCSKLKNKFGVEVQLSPRPRFHTVRRSVKRSRCRAAKKNKKQSGGHGQFGDVWDRVRAPGREGRSRLRRECFRRQRTEKLLPRGEKGLRDSINRGVLWAG